MPAPILGPVDDIIDVGFEIQSMLFLSHKLVRDEDRRRSVTVETDILFIGCASMVEDLFSFLFLLNAWLSYVIQFDNIIETLLNQVSQEPTLLIFYLFIPAISATHYMERRTRATDFPSFKISTQKFQGFLMQSYIPMRLQTPYPMTLSLPKTVLSQSKTFIWSACALNRKVSVHFGSLPPHR